MAAAAADGGHDPMARRAKRVRDNCCWADKIFEIHRVSNTAAGIDGEAQLSTMVPGVRAPDESDDVKDVLHWHELGARRCTMVRDGARRCAMVRNCPRRSAIVREGLRPDVRLSTLRSAILSDFTRSCATLRDIIRSYDVSSAAEGSTDTHTAPHGKGSAHGTRGVWFITV